ncbi:HesA/MoeB/ThiF family protein [Helicobacter cappadocius]|uniref:Molybdopterin-synthase adenylyltransferase n=1 Tax=Helicobacter cappadocius TaxID=3063998 RepID=A0AA90PK19_9HELI|nr:MULTISPECIES: HesA/MoeB/ThiF family protein [unclassified Helicobacter]MDO7252731.1 HesA/MoeB/ThiF family protein [Helicobacter sp. faydin-H75]MDP2538599.1 HesA/MoeB/ThiF family protein [Helicobacter sp. faydin-H76]
MKLTQSQKERYLRHIMLEDVGEEGQEKLLHSSVLIIGAGGLGSPNAMYLTAAGIGKIGILDFDIVEISNLQRQIIHTTDEISHPKTRSAKIRMNAINPEVEVHTYFEKFTSLNALKIVQEYDFIIDATDNFAGKFLINDACILANKPYSHAGVLKYRGQTMTVIPHKTACFACAFDTPPPVELNPKFRAGLFGVIPGIIGCIQAAEAIKYLLNIEELITNNLLMMDAKTMDFRKIQVSKNPECRVCGKDGIKKLKDYPQ